VFVILALETHQLFVAGLLMARLVVELKIRIANLRSEI
jgi:hypothetical protein